MKWHRDIWDGIGRETLLSTKKLPLDDFWTVFRGYFRISPEFGVLQSKE